MDYNLIAREKEEKIAFWLNIGIIVFSHCMGGFFIIPMILSFLSILADWGSNVKYYITLEYFPQKKTTGTKWFNVVRLISFGISIISFGILYFLNLYI